MKTLILLLYITTSLAFGQTDSLANPALKRAECLAKMKTGKFEYRSSGTLVTIKRTKKKHIESYGSLKAKLTINWTSDSTYVLKTYKDDVNGCLKLGDPIYVTITTCKDDKYTAKYHTENCGKGESVFTKTK